jgi:hypothetical protein
MARRRFKRAGFNTKLIMDVGLAAIGVDLIPSLLSKWFPLDPTLYEVAGAGGTWVLGSMLKKPDMANAAIALGVVKLVEPAILGIIGGGVGSSPMLSPVTTSKFMPAGIVKNVPAYKTQSVSDYLNLNDYVSYPSARSSREYQFAY